MLKNYELLKFRFSRSFDQYVKVEEKKLQQQEEKKGGKKKSWWKMSNMWLLFEGFWLNGQLLGRSAAFSQIDRAKKKFKK